MAMTWRQIETSRQRRLWFTEVIFPLTGALLAAWQVPDFRELVTVAVHRVECEVRKALAFANGFVHSLVDRLKGAR